MNHPVHNRFGFFIVFGKETVGKKEREKLGLDVFILADETRSRVVLVSITKHSFELAAGLGYP